MMSLEQNVERVNVEDLTEAAIQRCSLKKNLFQRKKDPENDLCVCSFFKKFVDGKPAA